MTTLSLTNNKLFSDFLGQTQEEKSDEIQLSITIMGGKKVGKTSKKLKKLKFF